MRLVMSRAVWLAFCLVLTSTITSGCTKSPAQLMESAKQREAKADLAGAIVDLKAGIQQEPNNGTMRFALGRLHNAEFDGASAEKELRKAHELGTIEGGRVMGELARALRAQSKYKTLLSDVRTSSAFEAPQLATIFSLRGIAHLGLGERADARKALEEARRLSPESPEVQLLDAQLHVADANIAGAEAIVDGVLNNHPKNFEALAYKARILRDQGKQAEALKSYDRMLAIHPKHLQALMNRSSILIAQGKLADAKKDLDVLTKTYKGLPQPTIQRGVWQLASGHAREAIELAQLALKFEPEPMPAVLLAGLAHLANGSPRQAEAFLARYLSVLPNNATARRALADALIRQNQGTKALEILGPLLETGRQDSTAYALAGEAVAQAGNLKQATQWYEKAAAIAPGDMKLAVRKALLRIGAGELDLGMVELADAVRMSKSATQADELLVLGYLERTRLDEAMAAVESMEARAPQSPLAANLRGLVSMAKGDRSGATAAFEKAMKLQPAFYPAAKNLAQLDLINGKPDLARKRFDVVLSADANNLPALLAKAEVEQAVGDMKESLKLLRRAAKAHPRVLEPRVRAVNVYLAQRDVQGAIEVAEEMLSASPDDPIALRLAANVQLRAGNANRALQALGRLTLVSPTPDSFLALAQAQVASERANDGESSLRKALQLQKDFVPAQTALSSLLMQRGRFEDAIQFARSIQAERPSAAIGFVLEGEVYEVQKRWDAAVAAYREAAKRQDISAIAVALYRVRSKSGDSNKALGELESWLAKNPQDRVVRHLVASAYLSAGDVKAAVKHFEALVKANERDADAFNGLAWASFQLKDPQAIQFAESAFKLDPRSPFVQDTLGWLLTQKGETNRGLELLRAASKALPQNSDVRYHLAVALVGTGDRTEARKELESALAAKGEFSTRQEAKALLASLN
ncbi:MAG: PEP-CTERM system TPR-repeat protein PrsT [Betaproteobacteria bacterium]|nr:PEP-CTERM system TPR-repeat protein PrsT [Betaproteobacteria bacterium]